MTDEFDPVVAERCENLWKAVLEQVFYDLRIDLPESLGRRGGRGHSIMKSATDNNVRHFREAAVYVLGPNTGFEELCEMADKDYETCLKAAVRVIKETKAVLDRRTKRRKEVCPDNENSGDTQSAGACETEPTDS